MIRFSCFLGLMLCCVPVCPCSATLICDIVEAEELLSEIGTDAADSPWEFLSEGGVRLELCRTPADAEIQNVHAGDEFVPVDAQQLRRVLLDVPELAGPDVSARIYCLPGLPVQPRHSFTVGGEIFLIPALGERSDEVVAATLVHELGHVVQNHRMPGRCGQRWLEYLRLRGIDDPAVYHDGAVHRDRPGEIFAEDFRLLFGGALAQASGQHENPDLAAPGQVRGLLELMQAAISESLPPRGARVGNRPNPFNPDTVILAELPDEALIPGAKVGVQVYDLRGRLLRELPAQPVQATVRFDFDGLDGAGRRLASGSYVYRIATGEYALWGRMSLIK